MPLIARQRSRLAVLAVLALVGSLLAVSAVPVAADDGKAAHPATYSACVGDATEDAGFTDMEGSYVADAANCLAHYGITRGTTTTTYSPSKPVTRTQMALFLARAAGPAGIDLGDPQDQGLTDLDGTSDEARNAINQVVKAGIMDAPGNEFAGVTHVTREEMAVHLDQFLTHGFVGNAKGINPGDKYTDAIKGHKDLDTILTDLGTVTYSAYGAIQRLYDLGVAKGKTATTYNPTDLVSRAQMAAFITRTLAHTNARPAGLTVQAKALDIFSSGSVTFKASVRTESHQPVLDAPVDQFSIAVGDDSEPFDDDGKCNTGAKGVSGPTGPCEITNLDEFTNHMGNAEFVVTVDDDSEMVWFWTGDVGNEYDNDETTAVTHTINVSPAAANVKVSISHNDGNNMAKFGETATVTIQLVDGDGDPVAQPDVKVRVDVVKRESNGNTASHGKNETTDADGQIQLPFTMTDHDTDHDGHATVQVTISRVDGTPQPPAPVGGGDRPTNFVGADGKALGLNYMIDPDGSANDALRQIIQWDDDASAATSLKLEPRAKYVTIPDGLKGSATQKVSNTITVTVLDQYGDRIVNQLVTLVSSNAGGTADESQGLGGFRQMLRTRFGVERVVTATSAGSSQSFGAAFAVGKDDATNAVDTDNPMDVSKGLTGGDGSAWILGTTDDGAITIYWAKAASANSTQAAIVRVVDDGDDRIVVQEGETGPVLYVEHDADDQFNVDPAGDDPLAAKSRADFVKALKEGGTLTWTLAEDADGVGVNTFTYIAADAG